MRRLPLIALPVVFLSACEPPPDAPQGLDEASSFVIREFYSSDANFEAGLQGFMNWFYEEGEELVGLKPGFGEDDEPTDSFSVQALTPEDIAHLPPNPDGGGIEYAGGVVSLAEMSCPWQVAEAFLIRPDQNEIFDAFEGYERTYVNDLGLFEEATSELSFTAITSEIDIQAADFDPADWSRSILFTENQADPAVFLGQNVEPYPLFLDVRHGVYDLTDQNTGETAPTGVFAILTYTTSLATNAAGDAGLLQSYSIEINVQRPGSKTLRMLAVWAEPMVGGVPVHPGDPLYNGSLNQSVGTSLEQSNQLDEKCTAWAEDNPLPESSSCNAAGASAGAGWLLLLIAPLIRRRRA